MARKRVAKIKEEQVAAERIQNIARGNLARKRVRNIRKKDQSHGTRSGMRRTKHIIMNMLKVVNQRGKDQLTI